MVVERHVSPDGVLELVIERLDNGVILIGFVGYEWHTHPNLLDRDEGATDDAALSAYINRLLNGVAVVGIRRRGGTIVDAWIMDDPAFEADTFLDGETLEMRHWDGRPWSA